MEQTLTIAMPDGVRGYLANSANQTAAVTGRSNATIKRHSHGERPMNADKEDNEPIEMR